MIRFFRMLPALIFFLLTATCFAANKAAYNLVPLNGKAISDSNSYTELTLQNHLSVLLVRDPQAERFAASMAVNVGSYQDPKNQQGLAHLLEHMLFLGTKEHPKPGEYQTFINQHGGSYNAYTTLTNTNFYFDIQPQEYEEALARFSQFFTSPLLDSHYMDRERNAVNAEYKAKLNSERRKLNQAFKTLLNPNHPQSHFTVGSLKTLQDRKDHPLHKQLVDLYTHNYIASNMKLVLIANLPEEQLAALARKYFSSIPTGSGTPPLRKPLPQVIQDNGPHLQFVRPNSHNDTLSFCYQLDQQGPLYETHPSQYISYILGNEGKNSLYSSLKKQDLINNLTTELSPDYGQNALLCTKLTLTDKGVARINEIARKFFATISVIKSSPINPIYLTESQKLSKLTYDFHSYIAPQTLARILSTRMLTVPAKDILSSFTINKTASTQEVTSLLDQLNESNLLIQLSTKKELPLEWAKQDIKWQTEPWYQTKYSNNKFSKALLDMMRLSAKSTQASLPSHNPFIPESLKLIHQYDTKPYIVYNKPHFIFWQKSDASFNKPSAINFLSIRFDNAASSPKNTILNHLWTRMFNDSISDETYAPYMAGLGYSLYPHLNGITINTNGYSDKQNDYLVWLVDQLFLFHPQEEDFERIKSQIKKDLDNQKSRQAYQAANLALSSLITQNNYTTQEMENALKQIHLDDLKSFITIAKSHFDVVGYSTGNISKEDTIKLAKTIRKRFITRLGDHTPAEVQTKALYPKEKVSYQFESISKDNTVLYALIDTEPQNKRKSEQETDLEKAYFSILCTLLNSRFYDEFRTQQQLGYIVAVENLSTRNTPILGFLIQSPSTNTEELTNTIEGFIKEQGTQLQKLSDDDFQNAKNTLLSNQKSKAQNLDDNAYREWHQIGKTHPDFDRQEEAIKTTKAITKKAFTEYVRRKVEEKNAARILLYNQILSDKFLEQHHWNQAVPEGNQLFRK